MSVKSTDLATVVSGDDGVETLPQFERITNLPPLLDNINHNPFLQGLRAQYLQQVYRSAQNRFNPRLAGKSREEKREIIAKWRSKFDRFFNAHKGTPTALFIGTARDWCVKDTDRAFNRAFTALSVRSGLHLVNGGAIDGVMGDVTQSVEAAWFDADALGEAATKQHIPLMTISLTLPENHRERVNNHLGFDGPAQSNLSPRTDKLLSVGLSVGVVRETGGFGTEQESAILTVHRQFHDAVKDGHGVYSPFTGRPKNCLPSEYIIDTPLSRGWLSDSQLMRLDDLQEAGTIDRDDVEFYKIIRIGRRSSRYQYQDDAPYQVHEFETAAEAARFVLRDMHRTYENIRRTLEAMVG
jgi:predicted Rossmann-fold nucleotide-binding protein